MLLLLLYQQRKEIARKKHIFYKKMIDFVLKYNKIKLIYMTPKGGKIGRRIFVATSSADEKRSRENYSGENVKREYRNTEERGREVRNGEGRPSRPYNRGNGEGRPSRPYNRENGEGRPSRSYNRENGEGRPPRPYNRENGEGRPSRPYNNDRPRNNNYMMDKDKDEEQPKRRSEPRRTQDKEARFMEQQPDKFDIINRLEKEKKAMQRKEEEKKKNSKPARAVARPKRSNNIDWTREYENGSYDDDDMDMYLSN